MFTSRSINSLLRSNFLSLNKTRFFTTSNKELVGFIGLGNMGAHQAKNLIKKGYQLIVFDVNQENVQKLTNVGAIAANSPSEIAKQSKTIITMLPSFPQVRQVYCGSNGIFESIQSDTLLLDTSTIDPATARDVSTQAQQHNATMLDCPVSGGTLGAEAGTLTFMVGGTNEGFERAKPYLESMGKNIVFCGGPGAGQVVKICNNLLLGISMVGVSEAMKLGTQLGVDPKILASVINTSSGRCWSSDTYNPCPGVLPNVPSSRGYTGGFAADLMKKDLSLALQAANSVQTPLVLGPVTHAIYQLLSTHGMGSKDFSAVYEFLGKKNE
eukprot:TRINITY_DN476_c0_g1_i1.p1 TRINITY_DN476_c0_g1~~TRINITY_DN476_c0_g1_i1.p1  ORF type:complete len:326 (-),score=167.83 TRINITY_DN476_c0_g1_i1:109-1086(-)